MAGDGADVMPAIVGLLTHLLDTFDALGDVARRMHPPLLHPLARSIRTPPAALGDATRAFAQADWPERLIAFRDQMLEAAEAALQACEGLKEAAKAPDPVRKAYRAFRDYARAQEALGAFDRMQRILSSRQTAVLEAAADTSAG